MPSYHRMITHYITEGNFFILSGEESRTSDGKKSLCLWNNKDIGNSMKVLVTLCCCQTNLNGTPSYLNWWKSMVPWAKGSWYVHKKHRYNNDFAFSGNIFKVNWDKRDLKVTNKDSNKLYLKYLLERYYLENNQRVGDVHIGIISNKRM